MILLKIQASKRDDILKQKAEYEADRDARKARYEEQEARFYQAEYDVTSLIEEEVMHQLDKFKALQFDVRVSRGMWGNGGLSIRIECNENNKFDDDVALSWNYNVNLTKDGEVQKESSSWSGLKATTEAQLESLTQTLEALKYLNKVDWATVLNKEMPKYKDYITEDDPTYDRDKPNFDQMLLEADLEDVVGTDTLVKGEATPSTGYRGQGYYLILKETPAQYVAIFIPDYYFYNLLENMTSDQLISSVKNNWKPIRIPKNKVIEIFGKEVHFYQEGQD